MGKRSSSKGFGGLAGSKGSPFSGRGSEKGGNEKLGPHWLHDDRADDVDLTPDFTMEKGSRKGKGKSQAFAFGKGSYGPAKGKGRSAAEAAGKWQHDVFDWVVHDDFRPGGMRSVGGTRGAGFGAWDSGPRKGKSRG